MKGGMDLFYGPGLEVVVPKVLIHSIGQNPVTRPRGTAREAGECNLAMCPGSRQHADVDGEAGSQRAIQLQEHITEVSEVRRDLIY